MFTSATNTFWSLVMTGLADVDGFRICIQVCVWLGFPTLTNGCTDMKESNTVKAAPDYLREILKYFTIFQVWILLPNIL